MKLLLIFFFLTASILSSCKTYQQNSASPVSEEGQPTSEVYLQFGTITSRSASVETLLQNDYLNIIQSNPGEYEILTCILMIYDSNGNVLGRFNNIYDKFTSEFNEIVKTLDSGASIMGIAKIGCKDCLTMMVSVNVKIE